MKWADVRTLHLEISALCNAVCPQCARYPFASHYVLPTIDNNVWTLEEVKNRLPSEDLINITHYLINGTVGDFITNPQALEIVEYFTQASPSATILINTNGSARNTEFWTRLGQLHNVTVNFGIDGLADTHSLYRRNTQWQRIINNATTYIKAGGSAEWTMTIFAHNEHQVEDCQTLSTELGFVKFIGRHSDRRIVPARDRNGNTTHWLLPASNSTVQASRVSEKALKLKEEQYKQGTVKSHNQIHNTIPLPDIKHCDSINYKSIYVGANWSVAPCCFIGAISFTGPDDDRRENFVNALHAAGLTESDLIVTSTVKNIVERGFDFIYDKITTSSALSACYKHCHPTKSNYRISQSSVIAQAE